MRTSTTVLRRSLRIPNSVTTHERTPVLATTGQRVGHVHDVVFELGSGRTLYSVAAGNGSVDDRFVLVPADATHLRRDGAGLVVDEGRLADGTRERLLAS